MKSCFHEKGFGSVQEQFHQKAHYSYHESTTHSFSTEITFEIHSGSHFYPLLGQSLQRALRGHVFIIMGR